MYEDCFARIRGGCSALNEAYCEKGSCSFYKSRQQMSKERSRYPIIDYKDIFERKRAAKIHENIGEQQG